MLYSDASLTEVADVCCCASGLWGEYDASDSSDTGSDSGGHG